MPSLAVHMERSTNCQHGPTCMGATHTCQTVLDACWLATNLVMQRRAWMLLSLLQSGMQRPGISRVEAAVYGAPGVRANMRAYLQAHCCRPACPCGGNMCARGCVIARQRFDGVHGLIICIDGKQPASAK